MCPFPTGSSCVWQEEPHVFFTHLLASVLSCLFVSLSLFGPVQSVLLVQLQHQHLFFDCLHFKKADWTLSDRNGRRSVSLRTGRDTPGWAFMWRWWRPSHSWPLTFPMWPKMMEVWFYWYELHKSFLMTVDAAGMWCRRSQTASSIRARVVRLMDVSIPCQL